MWDLENLAQPRLSGMTERPPDRWYFAALEPNVGVLAFGGTGGAISVCDFNSPNQHCESVRARDTDVTYLTVPETDILIAGDQQGNVTVLRRIHQGWTIRQNLDGHKAPIHAIMLDRTTGLLFTGDERGEIRVWRMNDEPAMSITLPPEHQTAIWQLRVDTENRRLISGDGGGRVIVWQIADHFQSFRPLEGQTDTILDISAFGNTVVVSDARGDLSLWRVDSDQPSRNRLVILGSNIWRHAFVGTPRKLVGLDAAGNVISWTIDGSPSQPSVLGKMDEPRRDFTSTLSASDNGRFLIAGDRSGHVQL
ncbi:MAG TPA: WD40 repeat domain-containing protein [Candidatus Tectomicrobia bacterium]